MEEFDRYADYLSRVAGTMRVEEEDEGIALPAHLRGRFMIVAASRDKSQLRVLDEDLLDLERAESLRYVGVSDTARAAHRARARVSTMLTLLGASK